MTNEEINPTEQPIAKPENSPSVLDLSSAQPTKTLAIDTIKANPKQSNPSEKVEEKLESEKVVFATKMSKLKRTSSMLQLVIPEQPQKRLKTNVATTSTVSKLKTDPKQPLPNENTTAPLENVISTSVPNLKPPTPSQEFATPTARPRRRLLENHSLVSATDFIGNQRIFSLPQPTRFFPHKLNSRNMEPSSLQINRNQP